jgi:hypothetical protein
LRSERESALFDQLFQQAAPFAGFDFEVFAGSSARIPDGFRNRPDVAKGFFG